MWASVGEAGSVVHAKSSRIKSPIFGSGRSSSRFYRIKPGQGRTMMVAETSVFRSIVRETYIEI